jgi:hypothetical protein
LHVCPVVPRPLPAAAILSTVLHTGAIAWVGTRHDNAPRIPPVTLETPAAPVESEPVAVALLDDHTVSAMPALPSSRGGSGVARANAVALSTSRVTAPTPEPAAPARGSNLLTMRRPEVKNGLSSEFLERFLERSKPLAPKDIASERIADDIATATGHLDDPRWIANATPDQLRDERIALAEHRDAAASDELRPSANGHHEVDRKTFHADVEADGTVHVGDKSNLQAVHACDRQSWLCKIPIGAMFDVTDWAMRSHDIDPYASAKLKMLDDTRDERVAIGTRYRKELLAHSVELVQGEIAYVWANTPDPVARKRALFELWDDCAETGDAAVVEGGRAVRAFVVGFIRSKVTYTADELAQLNAHRRSKLPFAPYSD